MHNFIETNVNKPKKENRIVIVVGGNYVHKRTLSQSDYSTQSTQVSEKFNLDSTKSTIKKVKSKIDHVQFCQLFQKAKRELKHKTFQEIYGKKENKKEEIIKKHNEDFCFEDIDEKISSIHKINNNIGNLLTVRNPPTSVPPSENQKRKGHKNADSGPLLYFNNTAINPVEEDEIESEKTDTDEFKKEKDEIRNYHPIEPTNTMKNFNSQRNQLSEPEESETISMNQSESIIDEIEPDFSDKKKNDMIIIDSLKYFFDCKELCSLRPANKDVKRIFTQELYLRIKNLVFSSNIQDNKPNFLSDIPEIKNKALAIKKNFFRHSLIYQNRNKEPIKKVYFNSLYEKKSKYQEEIKKDLIRTFVDEEKFKQNSKKYGELKNILTAYSNYNLSVGYAQGLNFIAGHSLLLFDQVEDAFVFIDALIQKFQLTLLIGISNRLKEKLNSIGNLIQKFLPEIIDYLNKGDLNHEFFTANWVLTLFSNCMDTKHLFMVWDFMILLGWKFFDYFVVAVIKDRMNEILSINQNEICQFMKNLVKNDIFDRDFEKIIDNTLEMMINN